MIIEKYKRIILFFVIPIVLFMLISNYVSPNLFKINVPESAIEYFTGNTLKLNENTDKQNPLKILNKNNNKNNLAIAHRNLVFTSAGDNTDFHNLWLDKKNQNFDIMVVYYKDDDNIYNEYSKKVDYIMKRKGSKMQNLFYVYNNHRDILNRYDRFFVLDDDIIFKTKDINEMFAISKKYNLWICGPTFKNTPECKISHPITISSGKKEMRYTNFIEVNVPLFNRYALDKLMAVYDPSLIGYGIDYLYIWACGQENRTKYALVDRITCINPHDNRKQNNKRELYNIPQASNREKIWKRFAKNHGIKLKKLKTWKIIKL